MQDFKGTVPLRAQLPRDAKKQWTQVKDFIEKTIDGKYLEEPVGLVRLRETGARVRSRYNPELKSIKVADNCDVVSFVHELGHHLETTNPHFHERCLEFLRHRAEASAGTAVRVQRLSELAPNSNYGENEYAVASGFDNPYCGKIYLRQFGQLLPKMERKTEHGTIKTYDMPSTEVLSMGLQFLHDDPLTFVLGDPEYYQFVMNLLRGVI